MSKIETKRLQLNERITKAIRSGADADGLLEQLFELGRRDGMDDLIIDLHGLKVVDDEAIETAIENNGVCDPRKR